MSDRTNTYYAATLAFTGYSAQIMVGNGASPETFEAIAGVRVITPGDMSTEDVLRTHLRSPDAHKEHMPGMRDSGPFECEVLWMPTEQSQSNAGGGSGSFASGGLIKLWRNRTVKHFKIVCNGSPGTAWPFTGYVSKFQPGTINESDPVLATVAFQPTQAYDTSLP